MWSPTFLVFDPAKDAIDNALVKHGISPDASVFLERDGIVTNTSLTWESDNK